jgi:hypothetical protein
MDASEECCVATASLSPAPPPRKAALCAGARAEGEAIAETINPFDCDRSTEIGEEATR